MSSPLAAPPPPDRVTLYQSPHLLVVARIGFHSATAVVTFSSFTDAPGTERQGFGEFFLAFHRIDAIHVIAGNNFWYQYPDMDLALAAINAALPEGATRVTYGLSMGGYAAINFSEALHAERVVAISPQYSVDPRRMPQENRWPAARQIAFCQHRIDTLEKRVSQVFVLYDPHNPDKLHVDRIRRTCRVVDLPIPFAGHPVTGFLTETRMLSGLALSLIENRFSADAFAQRLEQAQRQSGIFLLQLRDALPRYRLRMRAALLERAGAVLRRALSHAPQEPDPWYHLARVEDLSGRPRDAILALRRYCEQSDYLWAKLYLARLLMQHDPANPEADTLVEHVVRAAPSNWDARLAEILMLERRADWKTARDRCRSMLSERPFSFPIHAMLTRNQRKLRRGATQPVRRPTIPRNPYAAVRQVSFDAILDLAGKKRDLLHLAHAILSHAPQD